MQYTYNRHWKHSNRKILQFFSVFDLFVCFVNIATRFSCLAYALGWIIISIFVFSMEISFWFGMFRAIPSCFIGSCQNSQRNNSLFQFLRVVVLFGSPYRFFWIIPKVIQYFDGIERLTLNNFTKFVLSWALASHCSSVFRHFTFGHNGLSLRNNHFLAEMLQIISCKVASERT